MVSKFKKAEAFVDEPSEGYTLLPFTFAAIDDRDYVATNMAGETLLLNRPTLVGLVDGSLSRADPTYESLEAKHFFMRSSTSAAIDLLALKTRTKYDRVAQFTSLHIFVVTLRCEHSCPYCQVSRKNDDTPDFDMSPAAADKSIDLMFNSPSKTLKVEFQGGESLLNFELIKYIVVACEARNLTERRSISYVIATNVAVLNDDMLAFCKEFNILISTSLDGPADLHNRNRPRKGGNSHELAVAGIRRARAALGHDSVGALMTTTQASLGRAREIIDEYLSLDFSSIFLRPLSPYGFAVKTRSYDLYGVDEWLDFYFEGLSYILDVNKGGRFFAETYATIILRKMLTPFGTGYVDLRSPAGIGIAAIVYNYDGNVYASDESRMLAEMGDKTFLLGNVFENSWEEIITNDTLISALEDSFTLSAPMCNDCAFEPFCGADPVFHHAVEGDFVGFKPTSKFCSRIMAICRHLIKLMRDDPDAKRVFTTWVNPSSC